MSTIVTRAGKGSPLSHAEVDANFTNLNTDKAERAAANTFSGTNTFSSSVTLSGTCSFTGANTFTNATGQTFRQAAGQDGVLLRGRAGGTSGFVAEVVPATLTANRVITLPNASGTVITTGDSGTVTSAMIATNTIVDADINTAAAIAKTKISGTAITAADTGTVTSAMIADGTIVNGDISAAAAIAKTKISGTAITATDIGTVTSAMIADGAIVDGDISTTAAIAKTKISGTAITAADTGTVTSAMIANGTIVDGDISATAAIAKTKISGTAITAADTGTVTSAMIADGTIVNGDISTTAEIAVSKLANGTARQLLQTDAAGTGVEWTNNVFVPGYLSVSGPATFGDAATNGNVTVLGPYSEYITLTTSGAGVLFSLGGYNRELWISAKNIQFVGSGGSNHFQIYGHFVSHYQLTPNVRDTTGTLTAAEMTSGLFTSTTPAPVTLTLPTATDMSLYLDSIQVTLTFSPYQAFEWSIINTGSTNAVTLVAATGHTIVGRTTVAANTSGRFMTRNNAIDSYTTYRIA